VELFRRWILEGAEDDSPATPVHVVDRDHPPVYSSLPVLTAMGYSPDGALLAVGGLNEVLLHHADGTGIAARLIGLSDRIQSLAFSPDGKRLAVTGGSPCRFGEVQIWDVAERKLLLSVSVTFDTIYGASWSPDGTRVAFGCADNTVRVIEAATGKQVLYQGAHSDWVLDTVFSTDASHLVSVSRDMSMKLTEVATERFVDNVTSITPGALKGGLMTVDRHPQKDELLIGGADGTPKIYKMYREMDRKIGDDYNLIRSFEPLSGRVFSVEFNADGSRFVAGSSSERTGEVRVYQSSDGKLLAKCEGQRGPVYVVAFRRDGREVASAGFDGLIRLNHPETGKLIKEFKAAPLTTEIAAATP
jgi:WD40 repeat protein